MSTYQSTSMYQGSAAEGVAARPISLTVAAGAAIGVAVLNLVSAFAILASVPDLVREQIAKKPGAGEPAVDPSLVDLSSDRARGLDTVYSSLAYGMIFWAVVLGILAYFALRGGRTVRIFAASILFVTAALKVTDAFIAMPGISVVTAVITGLAAPVAIVLFFLPATNAYGRAQRAARRPAS